MRQLAAILLGLGAGVLAVGLLRLQEDSWTYHYAAGQVLMGTLGVVFLASYLVPGRRR